MGVESSDVMPSSVIHLAVASEINKKINRDYKKLMIGAIAPDIWKSVGDSKAKTHFFSSDEVEIPDINKFLVKYKKHLDDDFVLGYYIHLYTDYLWFQYFIPEIFDEGKDIITKLDGTHVKCNGEMLSLYIYNDYTNLNLRLIEEYSFDVSIFYDDIPVFQNIIQEVPMDRIDLIVHKVREIIENTKVHKDLVFNMDNIHQFIQMAVPIIISELEKFINHNK